MNADPHLPVKIVLCVMLGPATIARSARDAREAWSTWYASKPG